MEQAPKKNSVTFKNRKVANRFVESDCSKVNDNWKACVTDQRVYNTGIIHDVPEDIPIDQISKGMISQEKQFDKIERIFRNTIDEEGVREPYPTDKIIIFIKDSDIPKNVSIFGVFNEVWSFFPSVLR